MAQDEEQQREHRGGGGSRRKVRIGDLLVAAGTVTPEQVQAALVEQKKTGQRLGRSLIELGFLNEGTLASVLARQLNLPFVDLRRMSLPVEAARILRETLARRFRAVVVEDTEKDLVIGMADPTDLAVQDELTRILRRPLRFAVVRESELLATIDRIYRRTQDISQFAEELGEELAQSDGALVEAESTSDEAPVAKLLQSLFEDALQVGASDIHIEPDERSLRIRQRIDGALQEHVVEGTRIASALVLKLKLLSGLDIAEKRIPQDGRFSITTRGRPVDVRIATLPTEHGESVVMRLLGQSGGVVSLDQIGMPSALLTRLRALIRRPHGLVLVTGPTGSGKTTTLYATLRELNISAKKIITVEDPVEYRLSRINQVQVNAKIDLNFARVLRSVLRHDPDIIMVGEMRDRETMEIGLRAALTGHLVLSTLHTNDAVSSALRLIDMGAEGYLVAATLRAVAGQRLVRRNCEICREEIELEASARTWLTAFAGVPVEGTRFCAGRGCDQCGGSGYRGRTGVYEFFELDTATADALRRADTTDFLRQARRSGFRPLAHHALELARSGVTTLAEVMRVAEEVDDGVGEAAREESGS
jgi:MSHA biogenesis protein MshE